MSIIDYNTQAALDCEVSINILNKNKWSQNNKTPRKKMSLKT